MGVTLDGFLRCASEDEAARVRAALPQHVQLTRAEPGCIRFDVTPTDDPLVWTVSEEFTDPAAFDAHQTRAGASDWARATAGIARDYTIKGMP
ncbi:putative quinol monooxygenase [uncultured Tateyamaria sp.]|uniref:putative quinol monooxygenase n=1 Tax=uncultured Tateyamaria sp. TaxID=455651 RepID=UPI0026302622|nr:putative quinol monooxygenase [uncultured Tateyamaria sp.]